ncbi:MAG: type II secretion system protein [Sedimentisphaerales bacterium]|nr:type II secretion system protein [Sedimentisphaerales bacterium]
MNYELRTNKGFTLIELITAVGVLAIVLVSAAVIFNVSIDSFRMATANAEIMQKFRVITEQLNSDFAGAIKTKYGQIRIAKDKSYIENSIRYDGSNDEIKDVNSHSIVFFANGYFQSTQQYKTKDSNETVAGNVAAIYYGLANVTNYSAIEKPDPKKKVLVRRQTILTSDTSLTEDFDLDELREYCNTQSLAELNEEDVNDLIKDFPQLNLDEPNDLAMYMAQGVDDFAIEYYGFDSSRRFHDQWRVPKDKIFYPLAYKFTFRIYDSKGIIKEGREFSYIVYVGG